MRPPFTSSRPFTLSLPKGALGLLLLGGCATVQKEKGHSELASTVEQRMGLKTGWNNGTPDDAEVAKRRRDALADGLTAREAAELALLGNPRLTALYEDLGVSQADMVQAGLLKNPSLGMVLGLPILGGHVELSFSLVQEFIDLFTRPLKVKVAKEQFAAEVQRVTHAALETVAEARQSYLAVQAAERELEVRGEIETLARATAEVAERQRRAGNINALTHASELASWEESRLQLAEAQLHLAEKREALNRALGLWGQDTAWTLAEKLPVLASAPALDGLEEKAMRQRMDLGAAKRQVELFSEALALAKGTRFIGRLEVGAEVHQHPGGFETGGPTLSIDLPIFDQRQALIARLEAQARQAQHQADGLAVEIRSMVREGTQRLTMLRRRAEHYRDVLLPLRAKVTEQTQLAYNAMQVGPQVLFAARREEGEAALGYLEALRAAHAAQVELELAVGSTLEEPRQKAAEPPAHHHHGGAP
jgi:outer membrane protein, heavy metal efflux system